MNLQELILVASVLPDTMEQLHSHLKPVIVRQRRPVQPFILLLFIFLLLVENLTYALPLPDQVHRFLLRMNRADLITAYEGMPEMEAAALMTLIQTNGSKVLSSGFNGVTFLDPRPSLQNDGITQPRFMTKVTTQAILGFSHASPVWKDILTHNWPGERKVSFPKADIVNTGAIEKELIGAVLWHSFCPNTTLMLPEVLSTDHLAFRRKFVEGKPLNMVLASGQYQPNKLWPKIIEIQEQAEQMLLQVGMTIDLANPANLIVSGTIEEPIVTVIDPELMGPSPETHEYYKSLGFILPEPLLGVSFKLVTWPLMPEQLLVNGIWSLPYEQALEYIVERQKLNNRLAAVEYLANLPRWKNPLIPDREYYANIDLAKCELALLKNPK